tara:strand:- start:62 stop:448 length:387 start_codon:yes stop_codon:yes gene_type:complete
MVERRGRPSEQPAVKLDKWVLETNDSTWYYDKNKSENGCWKVEHKFIPGESTKKIEINQRMYGKSPVVMVFKTSNRSNAKTKIKIFRKNIDYILTSKKLPGVPETSIILDLGVGNSFIKKYKEKYKLK